MLDKGIPRVVEIDLTNLQASTYERADLTNRLGGAALALALMEEQISAFNSGQTDPVILAIGPLTALFPVATKAVALFRSPLTGELGESHAGMRLGMAMRFAGYDAVVLRGRADRPLYLVINSQGVKFKPAGPFWGMSTEETGALLREMEGCQGHRSCMRIGPAGEKMIRFAGVNVDSYRHFGRLGLGAVFGSKLLKAVVIQGDLKDLPIPNPQAYNRVYGEIYRRVTETEVMEKYHGLGTAGNVIALNELRALPTRNLQSSSFEQAAKISGEAFAKKALLRKLACAGCPVGCIHLALYRTSFGEQQEYTYTQLAYDHELIYSLGSLLELGKVEDVLAMIEAVEQAGLDAISTGVALAWATEAQDKGLITESDLGCKLQFGTVKGYLTAIGNLLESAGPFYKILARGTRAAAKEYGGSDFALVIGGNEAAGYHTGYANLVGQAVGARHSHLDNAGYSLDQENLSLEQLAYRLLLEEVERCTLTSLCICLFARKAYDLPLVERALKSLGLEWNSSELYKLGVETYLQKRAVKQKLGFDEQEIRLPRRFFQTPSLNGMLEPWQADRLGALYREQVYSLAKGEFPLPG